MDEPANVQSAILYDDKRMEAMSHPYSRLKPIEPGDTCCNCGQDCDGEGFSGSGGFIARRVNGHPLCARSRCYSAQLTEYASQRNGCRCQKRNN